MELNASRAGHGGTVYRPHSSQRLRVAQGRPLGRPGLLTAARTPLFLLSFRNPRHTDAIAKGQRSPSASFRTPCRLYTGSGRGARAGPNTAQHTTLLGAPEGPASRPACPQPSARPAPRTTTRSHTRSKQPASAPPHAPHHRGPRPALHHASHHAHHAPSPTHLPQRAVLPHSAPHAVAQAGAPHVAAEHDQQVDVGAHVGEGGTHVAHLEHVNEHCAGGGRGAARAYS